MHASTCFRGNRVLEVVEQTGIPSKHKSAAFVDYVPAVSTHHPSLLPIEWLSRESCETLSCKGLIFKILDHERASCNL